MDPYTKAIDGAWNWNEAMFPYRFGEPETSKNDMDSGSFLPKSVVIRPFFDWGTDRRPNMPWHRTVVYETHVKGFTRTHPAIPEPLRGTLGCRIRHPSSISSASA